MVQIGIPVMWGGTRSMNEVNTGVLKTRVTELVNEHAKLAQVINDSVFSFGELGFHEVETSKYLTATLERPGVAKPQIHSVEFLRVGNALHSPSITHIAFKNPACSKQFRCQKTPEETAGRPTPQAAAIQ